MYLLIYIVECQGDGGDDKLERRWNEAVITQSRIKPTFTKRDQEKPLKNHVRIDCVP